jgi:hypothetical protein
VSGVLHGAIASYASSIVTSNLVVHLDGRISASYPGTGTNWANLAGAGNTTLVNSPAFNASDGSFTFNGSNYATMARPVAVDFTLSCWFKTGAIQGGGGDWWQGCGLLDCEMPGDQLDFGMSMLGGKLTFGFGGLTGGPPTWKSIQSAGTYTDNVWRHATATRVSSTGAMVLYVNGTQIATGTGNQTGTTLNSAPNLTIGCLQTLSNYFDGGIGKVLIYDRALSATEVARNYTATRGLFGV